MSFGGVFGVYRGGTYDPGARLSAQNAASQAASARGLVREVTKDIERLLMISEALWELLKEQHGYSDDDLAKKIAEIDIRDGKLDGRVSGDAQLAKCAECGRPLGKRRATCLYCGTPVARDPFQR